MRAVLVVNPAATTTTDRVREVISAALGHALDVDVVTTKSRGHAHEIAAEAIGRVDLVVALGGDGTVNEVANGLLAAGPGPHVPRLGIIPGGSTNVSARALGLPDDPVEATGALLNALTRDRERAIGLGRADDRWFLFSAGMGFDAAVIAAVESDRSRGRSSSHPRFLVRAVQTFFAELDRATPALTVETRSRTESGLFMAIVQNTTPWTFLANRQVTACPDASFDTALDLFAMRSLRTRQTLLAASELLGGSLRRGTKSLRLHDQPWIRLRATEPQPVHLDGDYLGEKAEWDLTWTPDALRIVAG
jgi:diacylglycerol kinase family enzyme